MNVVDDTTWFNFLLTTVLVYIPVVGFAVAIGLWYTILLTFMYQQNLQFPIDDG